jgi:hypothetical protein
LEPYTHLYFLAAQVDSPQILDLLWLSTQVQAPHPSFVLLLPSLLRLFDEGKVDVVSSSFLPALVAFVVFTIGGFYYFWTRVLGRTIRVPHRAHRVGSTKGHGTTTDVQTARERRLAALENANRAREETMVKQQAKDTGTIRERTNVNTNSGNLNSSNTTTTMTIQERQRINQLQMQERQKQQELEEKKKKQRQLYLRQKALREKEEEERRKDEELGPGWRAREDPRSVANLLEQQESKGGYKAPMCTRKCG